MSQHLLSEEFNDYLSGNLRPNDLLRIDDHLWQCESCREKLIDLKGLPNERVEIDLATKIAAEFNHPSYREFEAYVDGKLALPERDIVDVHLLDCDHCRLQMDELIALKAAIANDVVKKAAPENARKNSIFAFLPDLFAGASWPKLRVAALAVGLVGLGFVFFFFFRPDNDYEMVNSSGQNINRPPDFADSSNNADEQTTNTSSSENSDPPRQTEIGTDPAPRTPIPSKPDSLPVPLQTQIDRVLTGGRLNIPAELNQLSQSTGQLMSGGTDQIPFALTNPVGKIVRSNRPLFQWQRLNEADGYIVNIYDTDFNKVAASPKISTAHWQIDRPLADGRTYIWQVTAFKNGQETKSPVRPAPDAKFKVIDDEKIRELVRLKQRYPNEHLALGILYARAGLLDEAEAEFKKELNRSPNFRPAQKFLREIRQLKNR